MSFEHYDCLILGGGAAGVSCALELIDCRRSHVIVEKNTELGGQLDDVLNTIRNFAGGYFENGSALKKSMLAVAEKMKVNAILGKAPVDVDLENKKVRYADGRVLTGNAVTVCTGTSPRRLAIELDESCQDKIVYVTENLDQDDLKNHVIAVIGGGDSALIEAVLAADMCPKVFLLHRGDGFPRARGDLIADVTQHPNITILYDTVATRFSQSGLFTTNLKTTEEKILPAEIVVAKLGWGPNSAPFKDTLNLDASGYICVDARCRTSMKGIYAAGDITQPGRLAAAMGQGSIAAQQIHADLNSGLLGVKK